jgi:hypothetical protein
MEQPLDLPVLPEQPLDPEVFRRVWDRVMPDQNNSPLVVVPPSLPKEPPAPVPTPEEPPLCLGEQSKGDTEALKHLMEQAAENIAAGQSLTRRNSAFQRSLSALTADHRRAMRQLSAAFFLITGQRFRPAPPSLSLPPALPLALRAQFVREQKWERACLRSAQTVGDSCLKELCQELAQDGVLHTGVIRSLLEQM